MRTRGVLDRLEGVCKEGKNGGPAEDHPVRFVDIRQKGLLECVADCGVVVTPERLEGVTE
jgi:hypothetical protein